MKIKNNDHPYIIAYGTSKTEVYKYFVEVEKELIPVSNWEIDLIVLIS